MRQSDCAATSSEAAAWRAEPAIVAPENAAKRLSVLRRLIHLAREPLLSRFAAVSLGDSTRSHTSLWSVGSSSARVVVRWAEIARQPRIKNRLLARIERLGGRRRSRVPGLPSDSTVVHGASPSHRRARMLVVYVGVHAMPQARSVPALRRVAGLRARSLSAGLCRVTSRNGASLRPSDAISAFERSCPMSLDARLLLHSLAARCHWNELLHRRCRRDVR